MKRIIFSLVLIALNFVAKAQIPISNLPNTVNPVGAYVPVARNGFNYKLLVDSIAAGKLDSVKVSNDTLYSYKRGVRSLVGVITGGGSIDTTVFHSTNYHNTLYPRLSGSYSNPSWITALAFSKIAGLQDSIQKLRDSINTRLRISQAIPFDTTGATTGKILYIDRTGGDTIKTKADSVGALVGSSGAFSKLEWFPADEFAPEAGDSLLVHDSFTGKYLDVYRDGIKQPHVVGDTGWARVNDTTIKVTPPFSASDKFWHIEARDSTAYTQLTLQAPDVPPSTTIAYVSSTDGGNNGGSGTTRTFSHTTGSGSDRILLVGFVGDMLAGNDDVSSVTYNGVSMTLANKVTAGGSRYSYVYYLLNPASGAHNVVITFSSSHWIISGAVEYSGVQGIDVMTTNSTSPTASSLTTSVTTTTNNNWNVLFSQAQGIVQNAGSGATKRVEASNTFWAFFDSNGALTPAGSHSMTTTFSPLISTISHHLISLKPY